MKGRRLAARGCFPYSTFGIVIDADSDSCLLQVELIDFAVPLVSQFRVFVGTCVEFSSFVDGCRTFGHEWNFTIISLSLEHSSVRHTFLIKCVTLVYLKIDKINLVCSTVIMNLTCIVSICR